MQTVFNMVARLIEMGKTDGLMEKIDVYYLAGRLTTEEYNALAEALKTDSDLKNIADIVR